MNFAQLRDALKIEGGKVIIAANTLTPNIANLLSSSNSDQPIVLTNATAGAGDGQNETVVIKGNSSFLNVADLPVEARATLDKDGNAQLFLKYTLRGEMPGPGDWQFSRSFPDLPKMVDWDKPIGDPLSIPLDELPLFNSYFVVVSEASQEPDFKVDLKQGINFVSRMRPTGIIGIVESIFGSAQPFTIHGTIRQPKATESTLGLKPLQYPWDLEIPVPGILLEADLGLAKSLGSMELSGLFFRIYSPTTDGWYQENNTYKPRIAYSGSLAIPSADLQLDMVAPMEPGSTELLLLGHFEGVTVGKLANLADLAGTGDLLSELPDQIKQVGDALGKLELTHAGISLSLTPSEFGITWLSFTIGMPELNWKVWDDHFEVDSIACRFEVSDPFPTPQVGGASANKPRFGVTVFGSFQIEGVPLNVFASKDDGYTLYAELGDQQTIPLKQLMQTYVPAVPAPGDLTINTLRVSVAPMKSYSMALAMAQGPNSWDIDVGFQKLRVSDVVLAFAYPRGGPLAGSFSGNIAFGNFAQLSMRYDIPGSFVIRALFPEIKLSQLVETLSNQEISLPSGFDLTFINSSVLIQSQQGGQSLVFQLGTQVEGVGSFAFEVRKVSGTQWGVAAGLDISSGKMSSLPSLGPLSFFEDLFNLQKLVLVVSSFEDTNFSFPDLAAFNTPQLPAKQIKLPGKSGVIQGFNLHGEWVINTEDKQQNLLGQLLGLNPVIDITLQVGSDPRDGSRLYVGYSTTISGHPLVCQFGGQLIEGSLSLFLTGSMTFSIQGHDQTFTVVLLFVANGAFLSATMKGTTPIAISFGGVEVFQIGNLALEIGISWEGLPSLGIAGTIEVADHEFAAAVFFDSAEPQKSMVAAALSDVTLKEIVDTMTAHLVPSNIDRVLDTIKLKGTHEFQIDGSLADDLNNLKLDAVATQFAAHGVTIPTGSQEIFLVVAERGSRWFLTDLKNKARHYQLVKKNGNIAVSVEAQLYCAPQKTAIGALTFDEAFFISGAISFLGYDAEATIEIDPSKGIAVDAQMDKLVIGNETVFSIRASNGEGGPIVSAATFTQPQQADEKFKPPHFYINGHMEILGLSRDIYVSLTESGLEFDFNGNLLSAITVDLHGKSSSSTFLGVGGTARVGIDTIDLGLLGNVDIDTDAEGTLDLKVDAEVIAATLQASFRFAGQGFDIPKFNLDVTTSALRNLAETLYQKIKDVLIQLLTDAARWAAYVAKGFITGVEDVVKVLQEQFGKTAEEAKKIYDDARGIVEEIADDSKSICSTTTAAMHL